MEIGRGRKREGGRKGEIRDFLEMIRGGSGIPILTHSMKDLRAFKRPPLSLSLSFFLSWLCQRPFDDRYSVHVPVQTEIQSDRASNHLPSLLLSLTQIIISIGAPIFNRGLIVSRLALNLHRFNQISPIFHGWKFDRRKNSLFFFFFFKS